jgi:hypothetical protein
MTVGGGRPQDVVTCDVVPTSLPLYGRVSDIVLAMRLRIRAMPRHGHVSAKTECEVRQVVVPAWLFAAAASQKVARMKPTGPARSGGPDDKLHEIREKSSVPVRSPGFAALHPGCEEKEKIRRRNADRCNFSLRPPKGCYARSKRQSASVRRRVKPGGDEQLSVVTEIATVRVLQHVWGA